jgi:hypothetical protein
MMKLKDSYSLLKELNEKYDVSIDFKKKWSDSIEFYNFKLMMDGVCPRPSIDMLRMVSDNNEVLPEFCMIVYHPVLGELLATCYPKMEYKIKRVRMSKYKKKGVK